MFLKQIFYYASFKNIKFSGGNYQIDSPKT